MLVAVTLICEVCGRGFVQFAGRPAKRCPGCRPERARRYGNAHQRRVARERDDAYGGLCARCRRLLEPGQEIHLDHADGGAVDEYIGWSHAACNLARRPVDRSFKTTRAW